MLNNYETQMHNLHEVLKSIDRPQDDHYFMSWIDFNTHQTERVSLAELINWCEEFSVECSYNTNGIWFASDNDALTFKMRWF